MSDNIREKLPKKRKSYVANGFFDDATSSNALNAKKTISFDQMNLSRALLKVICIFHEIFQIRIEFKHFILHIFF